LPRDGEPIRGAVDGLIGDPRRPNHHPTGAIFTVNKTDWDPNYKHPGKTTVRLTLFWVSNYYQDTSQKVLKKAEQMLTEHGLGLEIYPKSRQSAPNHTIQIPGDPTQLLVNDPENTPYTYNWLRNQAAAIFDDQATKDKRQRLPVFFLPVQERWLRHYRLEFELASVLSDRRQSRSG
jgi:hypothetical protein